MKQHHFSLRFFLFGGMLCLLISITMFASPIAEALSSKIREFPITTAGSNPVVITTGPDGNLWFTESSTNRIGSITPQGVVTEFPIPTVGSTPFNIAAGSDGNLWFTEDYSNQIGQLS